MLFFQISTAYRYYTILYLFLEYQSICPFVRIGSPRPLSRQRVCPPPQNQRVGGGQHSLAGEGAGGADSDDWRESLALCILCDLQIVRYRAFRKYTSIKCFFS
jgi:hypothetical protein